MTSRRMNTPTQVLTTPVFAAAQLAVRRADTAAALKDNLETHARAMATAAAAGVDVMVCPELSLTGYELDLLDNLALALDTPLLLALSDAAQQHQLTALVGAPIAIPGDKPRIGCIILHPDGTRSAYAKQYLHASENNHASPGEPGVQTLRVHDAVCAPAICYDTEHRAHARGAREAGASAYLAGVLWSEKGYAQDAATLAGHARELGLLAVLANHGAPSGGYQSAGQSAIWAPDGSLIACAPPCGNALVIAQAKTGQWQGTALSFA